jgi:hypothetical protein
MAAKQLSDKGPDGTKMGQAAADLIAFYGTTPVSQRASSDQATVASSGSFGATQAALLNEIRNTLVALGLMKGAA